MKSGASNRRRKAAAKPLSGGTRAGGRRHILSRECWCKPAVERPAQTLQGLVTKGHAKMKRDFERAYFKITGRMPRWWGTGIFAWRLYVAGRVDGGSAMLKENRRGK